MLLRYQPCHRAFTRVELLIVVAMLVIVAGLGIVGVRKWQDQANRTACQNNLLRIGLAIHTYNDVYKKVPPAWNPDSGNGTFGSGQAPAGNIKGPIHFLLLPYMESKPLYQSANGDAATIAATIYEAYLCPADPSLAGHLNRTGYASTSYAANLMVFDPYGPGSIVTAMPRGCSNTIMFAERYQDCQGYQPAWANHPAGAGGRNNTPVFGWNDFGKWSSLESERHTSGNPSFSNGTEGFQIAPAVADCDPRISQGSRPRTMQILLGDGSVSWVSSAISNQTWVEACDPSAGEGYNWIE